MNKKLLVVAPHMDDEVLSFGGLIRRKVCEDWEVRVLFVHSRRYDTLDAEEKLKRQASHMLEAQKLLGYQQRELLYAEEGEPGKVGYYSLLPWLEGHIEQFGPSVIAIPGRNDLNQDHRHLWEICRIATRPGTGKHPRPTILESIAPDHMQPVEANFGVILPTQSVLTVIKAMQCYTDELRISPHPRSAGNLEARYRYWGAQFGYEFAEPYRLVRGVE